MFFVLGLVFLASGASALLFETLWFRQAGLAFGNTVWASALVLAGFMTGLAGGNALAARVGPRVARPLRAYAVLELVIAGSGVGLVFLLPALSPILAPLQRTLADAPVLLQVTRFAIALLLLQAPAFAMGLTLPLLVEALSERRADFGRALSFLYGANTLGAVAGAVAGESLLIARLGIAGTALVAASLDVAAALVVLAFAASQAEGARARSAAAPARPLAAPERELPTRGAGALLVAAFLAGGILLALEVVWFRFLVLFVAGTSLAFALMLAVVLAGIALGSLVASGLLAARPQAHRAAAGVAFATGAVAIAAYALFPHALRGGGVPILAGAGDVLRIAVALMLPVSLLSGVLFPLVGKLLHERVASPMRAAGLLTLANTGGAALGPLLAGFFLLPAWGMERSFFALVALYGVAGLCCLAATGGARALRRVAVASAAVAFGIALALFPWGRMESRFLAVVEARYAPAGERVVAMREGLTETVHYTRRDLFGEPFDHRLVTNGYSMSGTALLGRRYMDLFVQLPVALHPEVRSALLLSYGVGTTARAITRTREIESIHVVDVSRDVLEMNRLVFPDPGEYPLDDPRVRVHVEDGRHFLQTSDLRFDLITSEPPPPKYAGIVYLCTEEYFRLMRERLADGGIATYWLPVNQLSLADTRAMVAAFCNAFEDCSLWAGSGLDWILMGTRDARGPVERERFERQWREPEVARELLRIGVEKPEQLGALFLYDAPALRAFSAGTPPLTDWWPLRLSPRLVDLAQVTPAYAKLMDARDAKERFAASPWIARLWPPALREPTLAAFAWQAIFNDAQAVGPGGAQALSMDVVDRVLRETDLVSLPLWILGVGVQDLEAAERAAARGEASAEIAYARGAGRLAERRFEEAAALFAQAAPAGTAPPEGRVRPAPYLRLYALVRAGDSAALESAARELASSEKSSAATLGFWGFLRRAYGVDRPSSALR
jgi:spermidine synthase